MRISDWSSDVCSSDLEHLGDREAAVSRDISKAFEETATGTLTQLSARYADAPPKGEIVVIVGQPAAAPPASAADADAALLAALDRLPGPQAAGRVAKKRGIDRRRPCDSDLATKATERKHPNNHECKRRR